MPHFPDWRTINAQALVTGRVTRQSDGRLKAEFRLWDVLAGQQLAGQQYFTTPDNWRRIAHIISDAIYERLTGEKGYFDSRVVFVDETGPKERRIKRLAIMDQDGANVRYLTRGDELVLTPRFSPSTQEITYMAYGQGDPRVYPAQHRDRPARDRRQLSRHELRAALLAGRPARHHEPAGGRQRQPLRHGPALQGDDAADQHARRSTPRRPIRPTARRSASNPTAAAIRRFTSWRRPAAPAQRISFGDGTYSTPVWSPRGDYIAFTKQAASKFAIGVMKPDGSGERILTEGFHNEGPTFAPNGRVIMYFSDSVGSPGPSLFTIDISGPQPAAGADAELRVRSGLVAAFVVSVACGITRLAALTPH